jgi:hypothetical protein
VTTSTKSRTRVLFSAHTTDNKRPQQQATSTQARKQQSENDSRRSNCQNSTQGIMSAATAMTSTKSRTRLFSQEHVTAHNQQAQWHRKIALPRTNNTRHHHNDSHIKISLRNTFLA